MDKKKGAAAAKGLHTSEEKGNRAGAGPRLSLLPIESERQKREEEEEGAREGRRTKLRREKEGPRPSFLGSVPRFSFRIFTSAKVEKNLLFLLVPRFCTPSSDKTTSEREGEERDVPISMSSTPFDAPPMPAPPPPPARSKPIIPPPP